MRQYATTAELAAYPGGDAVPAGIADTVLVAASAVVDSLLTGVVYDVDPDTLLPTDVDVATVLRDAVCSIAAEAQATGALSSGATSEWQSVGIGNVSLSGRTTAEGATVVNGLPVPALTLLALRAVGVFQVNGR